MSTFKITLKAEQLKDKAQYNNVIGDAIKVERTKQRLTCNELAHIAGVAQPTIERFESGELNTSTYKLMQVAKALKFNGFSITISD